jgi:hypothetical protein
MAIGIVFVGRAGRQGDAHQADDLGGAVEKGMQAVCAHAQGVGEKAIASLGEGSGYVNYEYYYQNAPDCLIVGHHDRSTGKR